MQSRCDAETSRTVSLPGTSSNRQYPVSPCPSVATSGGTGSRTKARAAPAAPGWEDATGRGGRGAERPPRTPPRPFRPSPAPTPVHRPADGRQRRRWPPSSTPAGPPAAARWAPDARSPPSDRSPAAGPAAPWGSGRGPAHSASAGRRGRLRGRWPAPAAPARARRAGREWCDRRGRRTRRQAPHHGGDRRRSGQAGVRGGAAGSAARRPPCGPTGRPSRAATGTARSRTDRSPSACCTSQRARSVIGSRLVRLRAQVGQLDALGGPLAPDAGEVTSWAVSKPATRRQPRKCARIARAVIRPSAGT